MNKTKIKFFLFSGIIAAAFTVFTVLGAFKLRVYVDASGKVSDDITAFATTTIQYEQAITENQNKIEEIDKTISDNRDVKLEFEQYKNDAEALNKNIRESSARIDNLQKEIDDLKKEREKYESVSNEVIGEERILEAGEYSCPNDVGEGRYKITGSGNLLLCDSMNNPSISANLSKIDTSSYVLPIEEGDILKVSETVSIVEVN